MESVFIIVVLYCCWAAFDYDPIVGALLILGVYPVFTSRRT
jgi:hypothetical protein